MTKEEFQALQPGDRVRTATTFYLDDDEHLQLARVYGIEGVGLGRVVVVDLDDGRQFRLAMPTSLDRVEEDVEPLPLPG